MSLLGTKHQEATKAIGVTNSGGLLELFSTEDGSTWTLIVTSPDGCAYLVAAGTDWRGIAWNLKGPEA